MDASPEEPIPQVRRSRWVVRAEDAGKRLDVLLAEHVPGLSRRRARALISAGSVWVDGKRTRLHSRRVREGAEVVCLDNPFASPHVEALESRRLLHEDPWIAAIDKPPGVPSHPTLARFRGTALQLLEELLRRRAGRKVPLWPVHRLDAATSGLLVFAKSSAAARALSQNFARRRIEKRYHAVVSGWPEPEDGRIELPLAEGRLATQVSAAGKPAVTRYRTLRRFGNGRALLEVEPLTGRMHQVRVHLAAIGYPVVGDPRYGTEAAPRLYLHASHLRFPHPADGTPFSLSCPPPAEWFAPGNERQELLG